MSDHSTTDCFSPENRKRLKKLGKELGKALSQDYSEFFGREPAKKTKARSERIRKRLLGSGLY